MPAGFEGFLGLPRGSFFDTLAKNRRSQYKLRVSNDFSDFRLGPHVSP